MSHQEWACAFSLKGFTVIISRPVGNRVVLHYSFCSGFCLLQKETRSMAVEHEEWVRHDLYRIHWTAVAKREKKKVIQILYIRLWYSTIQHELIAHKRVKWSIIPDVVTEQNDEREKHQVIVSKRTKVKNKLRYLHMNIHVSTERIMETDLFAQENRTQDVNTWARSSVDENETYIFFL